MDGAKNGGHLITEERRRQGWRHLLAPSGAHLARSAHGEGCGDAGIRLEASPHEQPAAHAADGWARVTMEPGVAAVTARPGVTHAVTAIANAFYANAPVLVLSGKNPMIEFERGSLQEMDQ